MSSSPAEIRLARALPGLLREVDSSTRPLPLLLAGEAAGVAEVVRAFSERGEASFLRVVSPADLEQEQLRGAALLVVVRGIPTAADERLLEQGERRGLPLVCLALGLPRGHLLPYVRATDVIRGAAVDESSVAALARRIALTADEPVWALARGLPVLRRPVAEAIVRRSARQNSLIGAAVFVPGADLPMLTLNQLRMVLRIGAMFERRADTEGRLTLGAVILAAFGLRALARRSSRRLPLPELVVKGAIAGSATWALGKAAIGLADRRAT